MRHYRKYWKMISDAYNKKEDEKTYMEYNLSEDGICAAVSYLQWKGIITERQEQAMMKVLDLVFWRRGLSHSNYWWSDPSFNAGKSGEHARAIAAALLSNMTQRDIDEIIESNGKTKNTKKKKEQEGQWWWR